MKKIAVLIFLLFMLSCNKEDCYKCEICINNSESDNEIDLSPQFNSNLIYDAFTDSRDGYTYKTIKIGNQTWMAENLRAIKYSDGKDINGIYTPNNDEKYINIYGYLYTWPAAMNNSITEMAQGACPDGWHIPGYNEWKELIDTLGGILDAGFKLKETGHLHWETDNYSDNSSGFTALPAGIKRSSYESVGNNAYFWSSTINNFDIYRLKLFESINTVCLEEDYSNIDSDYAMSIRCIKD